MKHIPNTITLVNLLCGCLSIVATFNGQLIFAGGLILLAAVFDFLDGFLAKILNAQSELGKQLDSLADIVSFGVAPAMIAFKIMFTNPDALPFPQLPYIAFAMVLFSALRLAKFNTDDTNQPEYFIGMPTPANGMFWATLPFVLRDLYQRELWNLEAIIFHPITIAVLCVIFTALLVLPIRMLSLKLKAGFVPSWQQFSLVGIVAVLFFIVGFAAIPIGILIYPLFSLTIRK